jgi:hypothetical protein
VPQEIYREVSDEWSASIANRYPELASMAIFDCFDVPWAVMADVKSACRIASKLTGRRFTVVGREKNAQGRFVTAQVKRVG